MQLPASPPQVFALNAQLVPLLHEQDAPVQVAGAGVLELPPQPLNEATTIRMVSNRIV